MKTFDKKVRWDFKVACHGYGRNVKEALQDAAENLQNEIDSDYSKHDFEMIEEHETQAVSEDDIQEDEEEN